MCVSIPPAKEMSNQNSSRPSRICIVDDESNARTSLKLVVESTGEFECVATISDGFEALFSIPHLRPDLVLMDIQMPGMSGLECARLLKQNVEGFVLVFVSTLPDPQTMRCALENGGEEFLVKPFEANRCLRRIRWALWRRKVQRTKLRLEDAGETRSSSKTHPALSSKEQAVMNCLAKGMTYKEAAVALGISDAMVHKYQHGTYRKLSVRKLAEALNRLQP